MGAQTAKRLAALGLDGIALLDSFNESIKRRHELQAAKGKCMLSHKAAD